MDLHKRFGLDVTETTEHTRIIVVNALDTTFGIVVDGVSEVLGIDAEQIEPPPTGLVGMEQAYILGLIRMEDKIMILMNITSILYQEDQVAIEHATTTT